jgi:hypothetical protein
MESCFPAKMRPFIILDLLDVDVVNDIRRFNLEGDGRASQCIKARPHRGTR